MYSRAILPESSRMNKRFGFAFVFERVASGSSKMYVSASAGTAATATAPTAVHSKASCNQCTAGRLGRRWES
ncbi:hypothetical protein D3C72_2521350 [compost metagenome]